MLERRREGRGEEPSCPGVDSGTVKLSQDSFSEMKVRRRFSLSIFLFIESLGKTFLASARCSSALVFTERLAGSRLVFVYYR